MEFQLSIIPSQWGLLSLHKINWFDFLAVQVTRRSLLQHHTLKVSIIWCSAFFMLQHSQPCVPSGKTIALTIWIFVSRVMSLIFNTLSRFAIAFLSRSKHLISWLQSPSAVILEPKNRKPVAISTFPSSTCQAGMGWDAVIFFFPQYLVLSQLFPLSSFTLIKRLFSSSALSAIRVVSSAYLRLLRFLLPILIPACKSSSPAFLMMCSTYGLNKQGDSRQPCHTHFSILTNQLFHTVCVSSWPTYRFLRRQVRWSCIPISLRAFHSLSWSTQRLWHSWWNWGRCFPGIPLVSVWSSECWQFDLWFLFLF